MVFARRFMAKTDSLPINNCISSLFGSKPNTYRCYLFEKSTSVRVAKIILAWQEIISFMEQLWNNILEQSSVTIGDYL